MDIFLLFTHWEALHFCLFLLTLQQSIQLIVVCTSGGPTPQTHSIFSNYFTMKFLVDCSIKLQLIIVTHWEALHCCICSSTLQRSIQLIAMCNSGGHTPQTHPISSNYFTTELLVDCSVKFQLIVVSTLGVFFL